VSGTLIGVIYSAASMVHLRTIISDNTADDASLQQGWPNLQAGEAIAVIPQASVQGPPQIETLIPLIAQAHAVTIVPASRCGIVDANGLVVDAIVADPSSYQAPKNVTPAMAANVAAAKIIMPLFAAVPTAPFAVVQQASANPGDTLINGVLTPLIPATKPVGTAL
jgi:hypothetical protein